MKVGLDEAELKITRVIKVLLLNIIDKVNL